MEMVAARLVQIPHHRRHHHHHHHHSGPWSVWIRNGEYKRQCHAPPPTQTLGNGSSSFSSSLSGCGRPQFLSSSSSLCSNRPLLQPQPRISHGFCVLACLPSSSSPKTTSNSSTKLYVSGLSFRTTEESLRNTFQNFGNLVEVNLVMDRIAKRPRGFAFLRYATEEESTKAIEGMHGKFLDGRVIFVEVAKPRAQPPQDVNQKRIQY